MPRIALQLHEDFLAQVCKMMGVDETIDIFGDKTYAVIEGVSPTEFTFKLVDEDEIFMLAADDSDLQILSL